MSDERDQILVIRSLRESDLGLFAEHRAHETSRQRALNINSDIINELLAPDAVQSGELSVRVRITFGGVSLEDVRPIKKTGKNWRLGGTKIVGKIFAELDAADFMIMRSVRQNTGKQPITISLISKKKQPVVHAGIGIIVERNLKSSMAIYTSNSSHFSDLAAYCDMPADADTRPPIALMPRPEASKIVAAPQTVGEKIRSPWIMERMFKLAGDLSAPAQVNFIETVEALASQLRELLIETKQIVKLRIGHRAFWPQVAGKKIGFIDGGLANLSMLGSAPLAARVGGYVVTPGDDSAEREEFVMLKQLIDDLFEHDDGGIYSSLFPDYGALRDAARISIEAAGAVRLLATKSDLHLLMVHGALVNPVSRYSDLMSEGKIRHPFPDFSDNSLGELLPSGDPPREGRDRNFISVYLRQLELMRSSKAIVCGVVEREGTTSTVAMTILDSFREEQIRHLLPKPVNDWRDWYKRALKPDDDDEMEGQRISDSLLFRCLLREGEAILPVAIDRNELRRAPEAWKHKIVNYPQPHVSFVQVSEWSAPVRLELFEKDVGRFNEAAELVYHSSRLLPKYAFPAGLDIVDKYAKVPNWMARHANTRATVQALNLALQNKDYRNFDNLRRMLCGTGREWLLRPGVFR